MQAWDLFWRTPVKECFCTDLHHLSVLLFIQHLQKQPPEVFYIKKVFLEISQKACNFIRKETLAQVFSCEFCKISKNVFSTEPAAEHLLTTASTPSSSLSLLLMLISPIFVFRSNSEGFKEFESGVSFSLSHFYRFYFLFPFFAVFLSFVSFFLVADNKKNFFKLRTD